jgi:hypothetical protein
MTFRAISWIAVVIGLAGGTITGWPEPPTGARTSNEHVLAADFHVHAFLSDGTLTPFGIWWLAKRRALDVVAITNHNGVLGGRIGAWISNTMGPPIIIPGQEVTMRDAHVLGIGISHNIDSRRTPGQAIGEIHGQGGVAILAHPRAHNATRVIEGGLRPDAFELRSDHADSGAALLDTWTASRGEQPIPRVGDSDYHWGPSLAYRRTLVFVASRSRSAVLRALATGQVVGVDSGGGLHGDRALVERVPAGITRRGSDYRSTGILDAVTRLLGWLGIVGILAFGRRHA